jgi:murein DD-endopeptidase MepM/ murein hydrolase activator NlpD
MVASFLAGALVDGWLRTYGPPKPVETAIELSRRLAARIMTSTPEPVSVPGPVSAPAPVPAPNLVAEPIPQASQWTMPAVPVASMAALPAVRLRLPIDGVSIESFRGGFSETRGTHAHEAVDILVPRGTPIHAVQDGTIAKLFFSQYGGVTIYQFDPDARLCYYYAHLERYADGLHDGQQISQGEVLGYVGSSGNSPPDAPHLHFAIFALNADRKWWQGRPLDPYLVFTADWGRDK